MRRDFWQAKESELFSEKEISVIVPLSHSSFVRMRSTLNEHTLPYLRIGRKCYYQKSDVIAWLENCKHKGAY